VVRGSAGSGNRCRTASRGCSLAAAADDDKRKTPQIFIATTSASDYHSVLLARPAVDGHGAPWQENVGRASVDHRIRGDGVRQRGVIDPVMLGGADGV
jgi:hypothetical protein